MNIYVRVPIFFLLNSQSVVGFVTVQTPNTYKIYEKTFICFLSNSKAVEGLVLLPSKLGDGRDLAQPILTPNPQSHTRINGIN